MSNSSSHKKSNILQLQLCNIKFIPARSNSKKGYRPNQLYITVKDLYGKKHTFEASNEVKKYFGKGTVSQSLVEALNKKARVNMVRFSIQNKHLKIF